MIQLFSLNQPTMHCNVGPINPKNAKSLKPCLMPESGSQTPSVSQFSLLWAMAGHEIMDCLCCRPVQATWKHNMLDMVPPNVSDCIAIPILVCFVFGIIRVSLAAIPGRNSLVSVAGSWTLLRMHFAEFLKLFDIFARFNFYNFSSPGNFTNVLLNFYILHGAKNYFHQSTKNTTTTKTGEAGSWVVFNLENQTISNPTNSRKHFFRITTNQFYFWETL